MHDYTARIVHDQRVNQYRQEADASRLAREARHSRPRLLAGIRRVLSVALSRRSADLPKVSMTSPAKVTSAAD